MSQEKESTSNWLKKKYLYLDKFERYVEDDQKWKKNAFEGFKDLKNKVNSLVWVIILSCCLAAAALLVSVIH